MATDTRNEAPKAAGRSVAERLHAATSGARLKKGEHVLDLVRYRNDSNTTQVVIDDVGRRIVLRPAGATDRSQNAHENDPEKPVVKFNGGTIVMTRKRGLEYVARGVLEEVNVVDHAKDEDYMDAKKD